MSKHWWVLLMGLLFSCSGWAASFDCKKAATEVEKLVCADAELSRLDEELGEAYAEARDKSTKPFTVKVYQLRWLKKRDKCTSKECLSKAYQGMISYLKSEAAPQKEEQCLAPSVSWNDYQWYLIRGKGEPACEDMLSYLESRPKNAPPPVCPEERLPPTKDWSRPEARFLTMEERKKLLDAIPEQYRQKPGESGPVSYEWKFTDAAKMRVIHADISRDGKPEYLLGLTFYGGSCKKVTQCAIEHYSKFVLEHYGEGPFTRIYAGPVDYYDLFPMTEDGKQVDWQHPTVGANPMLINGELVYYKGMPYWLSPANWFQAEQDEPTHGLVKIDDPARAMFHLNGIGHSVIGQYGGLIKPASFNRVGHIRGDGASCYFGYFHHKAIERFQGKGGINHD